MGARRVTGTVAQHCPECGFANADGANYCQRCGAFLGGNEQPSGDTTAAYKIGETGEIEEIDLEDVVGQGSRARDPSRGRQRPARASRCRATA